MRLLRHLDREPGEAPERIAFTLQTGRESMPERLAVLASGTEELRSKLRSYLDGCSTPGVIAGRAPACTAPAIDVAGSSWSEIAHAWVVGAVFTWELRYSRPLPQRVSLPGYPFGGGSYWLTVEATKPVAISEERPLTPRTTTQSAPSIQNIVAGMLGEILGVDPDDIDPAIGFMQLGMESIQAIRLKRRIEKEFSIKLRDTIAFEYPTLKAISSHLQEPDCRAHPSERARTRHTPRTARTDRDCRDGHASSGRSQYSRAPVVSHNGSPRNHSPGSRFPLARQRVQGVAIHTMRQLPGGAGGWFRCAIL